MTRSRAIIGTPSHDSVGLPSSYATMPNALLVAPPRQQPAGCGRPRSSALAERHAELRQDLSFADVELARQLVRLSS